MPRIKCSKCGGKNDSWGDYCVECSNEYFRNEMNQKKIAKKRIKLYMERKKEKMERMRVKGVKIPKVYGFGPRSY